jgi:hypothetical protein
VALSVVLLGILVLGLFGWIFRRIIVLFAALEAVERIEDNAPSRGASDREAARPRRALSGGRA